jgi:hypothetical protein
LSAVLWETPFHELTAKVAALTIRVERLEEQLKAKKHKSDPTALGVSPDRFYRMLVATGKVVEGTLDPSTFGTIGRKMMKSGVVKGDEEKFQAWLDSGGLNWVKEPFVWNQLCRAPKFLLLDWIARAKAYTAPPPKAGQQLTMDDFLANMRVRNSKDVTE